MITFIMDECIDGFMLCKIYPYLDLGVLQREVCKMTRTIFGFLNSLGCMSMINLVFVSIGVMYSHIHEL